MAILPRIQDSINQFVALIPEIEAMPEVTTIQPQLSTIVIPGSKVVMPDPIGNLAQSAQTRSSANNHHTAMCILYDAVLFMKRAASTVSRNPMLNG